VIQLPKGWSLKPISHFVEELESGVSVNSEDLPAINGAKGVLKVSCVSGGRFYPGENKRILASEHSRARVRPRAGAILISRSNTLELVGANGYIEGEHPHLFLSDKLWQTKYREGVDFEPLWLSQVFGSVWMRRLLIRLSSGTSGSMKNISKERLLALEIPAPPYDEQRAIAQILCTWDKRVAAQGTLVEKLRKGKLGLMQQLLSGKRRFKEFKSEKWRTFRLGELFSERVEVGREDLPLVSITGQNGVVPRDTLEKRDTSSKDKCKYLRITPGDIGYNTMRMWQGVSGLSKLEGIVSPAYTVCVPGQEIDGRFAAYLFKHVPIVHLFRRYSQGLVDDTLALKFPNFAQIYVTIPNLIEQCRIAAVLETCDREIEVLQKQLDALKEQKRGLMQRLLTGEIRVKGPKENRT
jgi:type I restriction enzyme S subunit